MEKPEPGFYQHYKHTAEGTLHNYRYEVVGSARHTEDKSLLVLYRPLYGDRGYLEGADASARPLSMWHERVEWEGKTLQRFVKITDSTLVQELTDVRREMYGD